MDVIAEGHVFYNKHGTPFKIIRYITTNHIEIEFLDDYHVHKFVSKQRILLRSVRNPYDKTVFGIGCIGEGPYKVRRKGGKLYESYNAWRNMLERCYGEKYRKRNPTYENCTCCEAWKNYQNFASWYDAHFYQVGNERMHIDKDIKIKGNQVYSPETCVIIPQRINMIFATKKLNRRSTLPTGISKLTCGMYKTRYITDEIGRYSSLEESVQAYLSAKRKHIAEVVESYGDQIPTDVREVILAW